MTVKHTVALAAVLSIISIEPTVARDCNSMISSLSSDLDAMIADMNRINSQFLVDYAAECPHVRRHLANVKGARSTIDACFTGTERDETLASLRSAIASGENAVTMQCAKRGY